MIFVIAEDDVRSGYQPSGKQSPKYHSFGCLYTRTTGIWQTVWLEFVPKGEPEVAEFINAMDMRLFIMDYDHNAPIVSHLRDTHAPFFKAVRKRSPFLPILLLSRPNFDSSEDGAARRAVIEETYHDAVRAGDANVYYIDGETLFGETDRQLCTVDTIHPNDLGFYRMAKTMLPVIKNMLHSDVGTCR